MKHEVVQQLEKEYGQELRLPEEELKYMLAAVEKASKQDSLTPAEWTKQFFVCLRQTGKHPKILASPREFATAMICTL